MTAFYESHLKAKLNALDISQAVLCAYSGVAANKLSQFLSGQQDISNSDLCRINNTLADLERLRELACPWPVDFRKIREVSTLIAQMKSGELVAAAQR